MCIKCKELIKCCRYSWWVHLKESSYKYKEYYCKLDLGEKGLVTLFSIRIEAHVVPEEEDGSIASCWVSIRPLQTHMLKAQLFWKRSVPTFDRLLLVCWPKWKRVAGNKKERKTIVWSYWYIELNDIKILRTTLITAWRVSSCSLDIVLKSYSPKQNVKF